MAWDRIRQFLFGEPHAPPADPVEPTDQQQVEMIAAMAQRMVDVVNESMRIAHDSKNIETRRSRIGVSRERLVQLQELAEQYPFIKVQQLAEVECDLAKIDEATDQMEGPQGAELAAFLKLPLSLQCKALDMPLEVITLQRCGGQWIVAGVPHKRPEDAALAHLRSNGWEGLACEGTAVLMLMKAACLDHLARINTFGSRADACMRFFEAQCIIHRDNAPEIVRDIEQATEAVVRTNLAEIVAQPDYLTIYPMMDADALIGVWHAITPSGLATFARRIFDDPSFRAGWPDVTIAREGNVRFVEVKTTDKLHASQRDVILGILQPSGADVRVIQIKPARH